MSNKLVKTKPGTKARKKTKLTKRTIANIRITEKQRTIFLFLLLAIAIWTLSYIQGNVDSNFVDTL